MHLNIKKPLLFTFIGVFALVLVVILFFLYTTPDFFSNPNGYYFFFYRSNNCANKTYYTDGCILGAIKDSDWIDPETYFNDLNMQYVSTNSASLFNNIGKKVEYKDWACRKQLSITLNSKYEYACWPNDPLPADVYLTNICQSLIKCRL